MLFPYALPAEELRAQLDETGISMVLINTPADDWAAGGRGVAALPHETARFRADFARAMQYAAALDVPILHVMAGLASGPAAERRFIDNLSWAADRAAMMAPGLILTIEPINPHDMPGYFLNDFDQAAGILDKVNRANVALQFDAYHAHRITGDVMGTWMRHGHRAAHVQVAAAEGRHEPLAGGAIDYPAFFDRLDADGYAGAVSGEYVPAGPTAAGLHWMHLP
jgi:hydroxypyruvate isomerase